MAKWCYNGFLAIIMWAMSHIARASSWSQNFNFLSYGVSWLKGILIILWNEHIWVTIRKQKGTIKLKWKVLHYWLEKTVHRRYRYGEVCKIQPQFSVTISRKYCESKGSYGEVHDVVNCQNGNFPPPCPRLPSTVYVLQTEDCQQKNQIKLILCVISQKLLGTFRVQAL